MKAVNSESNKKMKLNIKTMLIIENNPNQGRVAKIRLIVAKFKR